MHASLGVFRSRLQQVIWLEVDMHCIVILPFPEPYGTPLSRVWTEGFYNLSLVCGDREDGRGRPKDTC